MLLSDYLSQKRGLPPLRQVLSSIKSYPLKNDFTFSTLSLNEIYLGHRSASSDIDDFITSLSKKDKLTTKEIYNFLIPLFFEKAQLSQTLELNKTIHFFEENLERLNLTRNKFFLKTFVKEGNFALKRHFPKFFNYLKSTKPSKCFSFPIKNSALFFVSDEILLVALIAVYFEQGDLLLNGENKEIPLALTGIFFPTANSLTGENYFHLFPEQQKWFLIEKLFYFIDAENNLERFLDSAFFFCSTLPITSFFYSIHFLSIDYINHYASFIRQRCLESSAECRFKYYLHYLKTLRLTPQNVVIFNYNNANILSYSFNVKSATLPFISYNFYFANCLSNDLPLLSENKKLLLQEEIDMLLMCNLLPVKFYNSNLLFYYLSFFKLHSINIADKMNNWLGKFLSFSNKSKEESLFFLFAFVFYDLNNHRARNLMLEKLLAFLNAKNTNCLSREKKFKPFTDDELYFVAHCFALSNLNGSKTLSLLESLSADKLKHVCFKKDKTQLYQLATLIQFLDSI